jgi:hypothetical protein
MPDTTSNAGNKESAASLGPASPWTEDEMGAAKPLPLPTVDAQKVGSLGTPYTGKGQTKPGGRPQGK